MKTNCYLCYKLENKTLSEDLQDYNVKTVFETERLQDSVWREGLQDYKSLSKRERAIFFLGNGREFGPSISNSKLDLYFGP